MPRITDLTPLLFPIAREPLLSKRFNQAGVALEKLRVIKNHYAIVNCTSGDVLGVVSRYYGVVTHEKAVELGRRCCRELLALAPDVPLEVFRVDAPSTGTHCHVDLIHPAYRMNLLGNGARAELYVPYVRVTNSYNGTRALRFDVGFVRSVCGNGVIFERETIGFSFLHLLRETPVEQFKFRIRAGQFQRLAARFESFVRAMSEAPANEDWSRAVIEDVLGLPSAEDVSREQDATRRLDMRGVVNRYEETLARYRRELGTNAYAVFNAMTELADTLAGVRGVYRDRNSMQRAVGAWAVEFCKGLRTAQRRAA
jgi:hypothetical protein